MRLFYIYVRLTEKFTKNFFFSTKNVSNRKGHVTEKTKVISHRAKEVFLESFEVFDLKDYLKSRLKITKTLDSKILNQQVVFCVF